MELIVVASSGNVMMPDGFCYFPNSRAPLVNRLYEVFKIELP